jgi:hypothetical protein
LLNIKLDILKAQTTGTIEDYIDKDHPLAKDAINATAAIMGLLRERVGNVPIVAFTTDKEQLKWSSDVFAEICKSFSIHYIDYVPDVLEEARSQGIQIDAPNNPHWNATGHSIVGKTILNYLIKNKLLK